MFQYYVALFGVCVSAFRNGDDHVILPLMEAMSYSTSSEVELSSHASVEDPQVIVHVIGDTHGDNNYLLRCLSSTKRVEIESIGGQIRVRWAAGMSEKELWEIVILGDMVDIGVRSRENLLILKSLADDPSWGHRLVVLLGHHESLLLQGLPEYADGPEHWSYIKRMQDLNAAVGSEGHNLIRWLRQRPVVYFSHGLLMMHGGLSKLHAKQIADELDCRHDCGQAIADHINNISHDFYKGLHQFYLSGPKFPFHISSAWKWESVSTLPYILSDESRDVERGAGVLWYRGWSDISDGAGSKRRCGEAEQVGEYFGPHLVMVVAHTTHPRIHEFCNNSRVPIFAVDTHPSECNSHYPTECDFGFRHDTHPKYKEQLYERTEQLPQSLRLIQRKETREFAVCYERNHEAYCRVLRHEGFGNVAVAPFVGSTDARAHKRYNEESAQLLQTHSEDWRKRARKNPSASATNPVHESEVVADELG